MPRLKTVILAGLASIAIASSMGAVYSAAVGDEQTHGGPAGGEVLSVGTPVVAAGRGRVDVEGGMIQIAAQRDGVITEIFVTEGADVRAGDLLARQDDRAARAALEEAKAALAEAVARGGTLRVRVSAARRERNRLDRLRRDGAEAVKLYDEAQSRLEEAEAELTAHDATVRLARARVASAEMEIAQREVRAPVDGRIVRLLARPGSGASTLNVSTLFTLVPNERFILRVDIEERLMRQVVPGQPVTIQLDSGTETLSGEVLRIGQLLGQRKLDPSDAQQRVDERVVEAIVSLPSRPDRRYLIGQRGLAKFLVPSQPATALLPERPALRTTKEVLP
ncbi:secretion protein (plasmid) [Azospirillum sp. B510]|uniref:HlyD family secretion protein n=1 Tax=Azospirillum sp. (strain B510) TaxID=137722 RepID=UPI0001C4CCB1|nr:HlyD family efflux transporter periplasmic adaptor subunit [Azospirillum sp. B510]BAI75422.1 secretion protein [Azospirillum sp. B510]